MVEIIDKTIVVLKEIYGSKLKEKIPEIKKLIELLHTIGSDYIEITPELHAELSPLPEEIKFTICGNNIIEIKDTRDIHKVIEDAKKNNRKFRRIIGLDDLIFDEYEKIFVTIKNVFGENVELCIRNKYDSAIAMTLEWIKSGGKQVVTTFAGIGGYAPLEEVLGSLMFLEKMKMHGNPKVLPKALSIFEEIIETKLHSNMPFIGEDIFNVESGIHVNGIAKNPSTYEPYDPSEIGRKRNIIIGKHSGISSLEIKLKELNIHYNSENLQIMLDDVRKVSMQKRRGLNNEEIKEIYKKCCG
ncbi:isopropylmalate/homocitrate/citramalate synthase-like protein [Clostridium sp. DL-VIII]|uniref:homocitrate synthase/isopropylmalate synthase family protein n=1 Tax=Clostridium sp. DL-VIII TaxID=641107 RepID=UPI00023B0182|nr:isopropylmalate synthase [Clostridium sp. DL-VIII]EHI99863.1 isopropylmalate/homocitrate/citramalate synthase-like protein [Clostridium sp. DL-VIII]